MVEQSTQASNTQFGNAYSGRSRDRACRRGGPSSDKANAATCIALDFDGVGNRTARSVGPVAPMWGAGIVWQARYLPFGEVASVSGLASLDYRFPGQWLQIETGLHYNWHRH